MQDYAPDAKAACAEYALVGHASRRAVGETESIIAEKLALAVRDGLIPVLCVGESRTERDSGVTHGVLKRQIKEGLSRLMNPHTLQCVGVNPVVYIAYEPIWAISSGKDAEQCSPETVVHRIAYIKEQLLHLGYGVAAQYLYGGSITAKNAAHYLNSKDINGLLVGAVSVIPKELKKIWHLASKS